MMQSPARASAALLLLLVPIAAQQNPPPAAVGYETYQLNRIPWPAGYLGANPFGRTIVGCFDDELNPMAIVMRGQSAAALAAPHLYTSVVDLGASQPLNDITLIEDFVQPGKDLLVAVGPSGLSQFDFDTTGRVFVESALGSSAWNDAERLISADVDGLGCNDLVGIAAGGMQLLVLTQGSGTTWVESTIALDDPAFDVVVLDYFPGAPREFAALTTAGVQIYDDVTPGMLLEMRSLHPGGALALCESVSPSPSERIAWLANAPNNEFMMLQHFDYAGIDSPLHCIVPPKPMDPAVELDTVGVVAGDWDGDGLDDVVLPHTTYQRATLFLNQGETQNFSGTDPSLDYLQIDLGLSPDQPAPENQAVFGFGGLGTAGRDGIVAPQDSTQSVGVLRKPTDQELHTRTISAPNEPSGPASVGFFADEAIYEIDKQDENTANLYITLDDVPLALRTDYNHLQIVEWRQVDPTQTETDLHPTAARNDFYPIVSTTCAQMAFVIKGIPHSEQSMIWSDKRHVWFELRFVELDANDSILSASQTIALGLTLEPMPVFDDLTYATYLLNRPGHGGRVEVHDIDLAVTDPGDSEVGSLVVQQFLPPFPTGTPPVPGDGDVHGTLTFDCAP